MAPESAIQPYSSGESETQDAQKLLSEFNRSLVDNAVYSDFVISSGSYKWPVHRIIITKGSKFFDKLCKTSFKEASDQSVELPDDEPRSIHRLLMYLYKDDYATTISMSDFHEAKIATRPVEADMKDPEEEPMVHAAMYAVAEKYDIAGLKRLSAAKFEKAFVGRHVFSAPPSKTLMGTPVLTLDRVKNLVETIYTTTVNSDGTRHLRDFVAYEVVGMLRQLHGLEGFKELIEEHPDFGWDLIVSVARDKMRKECRNCGTKVVLMMKPSCRCEQRGKAACGQVKCKLPERDGGKEYCPGCGDAGTLSVCGQ